MCFNAVLVYFNVFYPAPITHRFRVNVITVRLDVGPEYQNEGAPNLAMGAMKGEKEA
jgi:hypothetical protein